MLLDADNHHIAGNLASAMVTSPTHNTQPGPIDIGHFFLAMDSAMFRDTTDFPADVAAFCNTLRTTRPAASAAGSLSPWPHALGSPQSTPSGSDAPRGTE